MTGSNFKLMLSFMIKTIMARLLRIEDIHCVEDTRVPSSTGDRSGNVTLNKLDVPNSLTAFTASNRGIQVSFTELGR